MSGKLIVFEGIDGAGKSTNMNFTQIWLFLKGFKAIRTEWKSSNVVSPCIATGKKDISLKPRTFSLLHVADLYDRQEKVIIPHLEQGGIVLADRWYYTGLTRDSARGLDEEWVKEMYKYAIEPDLVFYFKIPLSVALDRIKKRGKLGFYEAGMDLGLSNDREESYKVFQGKIQDKYDELSKKYNFVEIDSTKTIEEIQKIIHEKIKSIL